MKHRNYPLLSLGMMFFFLISACAGPGTQPPATEVPHLEPPATEVPATEAPSTEIPADLPTELPPTLEPINLAGPPMQVGSTFQYVDGSILVAVPAGEFIMGHGRDDNPEHMVYLDDFWIYRAPVTNQQYAFCVNSGNCAIPDLGENTAYGNPYRANDPVVGVNWDQAASYCSLVGARLPTEAEWEKAARGPDGNIYPWGNLAPACDLLNAAQCVNKTTDVTTYPQGSSFYEAFDMAGNVFEWVADWYNPTYYVEAPTDNPPGPETGERRSVRSSGFNSAYFETEAARRFKSRPTNHRDDLGFRCVVDDPLHFAPFCEQVVVYGRNAGSSSPGAGSVSVTCPTLSISQAQWCGSNNTPLTNVTFSAIPASTIMSIHPGSCVDQGGNLYLCDSADAISVCADCTLTANINPNCPPGYTQAGNTCQVDQGYPGECLPGFNYDPDTECCTATTGAGASFPLCPIGTYFANPPGACVPIPTAGNVCENDTVSFKSCTSSGGGGCQPPVDGCGNFTWDSKLCCCVSRTGGCVNP